jgi:hypothetical protein
LNVILKVDTEKAGHYLFNKNHTDNKFSVEQNGNTVTANLGYANVSDEEIINNYNSILKELIRLKPKDVIGRYILKVSVQFGDKELNIDLRSLNNLERKKDKNFTKNKK